MLHIQYALNKSILYIIKKLLIEYASETAYLDTIGCRLTIRKEEELKERY